MSAVIDPQKSHITAIETNFTRSLVALGKDDLLCESLCAPEGLAVTRSHKRVSGGFVWPASRPGVHRLSGRRALCP